MWGQFIFHNEGDDIINPILLSLFKMLFRVNDGLVPSLTNLPVRIPIFPHPLFVRKNEVFVFNATGAPLTEGQIVYVSGAQGNRPSVLLASSNSEVGSSVTLGMVTEPIATGAEGFVTTAGMVNGLNTSALVEGSAVWLGSTPGTYTTTKPSFPQHRVLVGYVVRSHTAAGSIFVKIQNGSELDELHDVNIVSPTVGQVLSYTGSHWANSSVVGFTGSAGFTGSQGIQGVPGFTGSVGFTGSTGFSGSVGFTGSQGPIGFTGSAGSGGVTVLSPAYFATMSVDVTGGDVVRITLTGNLQLGFTGGVDGQKFIVELIQDGVGGRTISYDSSVRFGTDIVATTLSTAANKIDRVGFIFNQAAGKYDVIAFAKGY